MSDTDWNSISQTKSSIIFCTSQCNYALSRLQDLSQNTFTLTAVRDPVQFFRLQFSTSNVKVSELHFSFKLISRHLIVLQMILLNLWAIQVRIIVRTKRVPFMQRIFYPARLALALTPISWPLPIHYVYWTQITILPLFGECFSSAPVTLFLANTWLRVLYYSKANLDLSVSIGTVYSIYIKVMTLSRAPIRRWTRK